MLAPNHFSELLKSAIDPDLARLNFRTLTGGATAHDTGTTPFDYLCYSKELDRTNTGRLAAWILNRYRHIETGGWWCSGVDPLNNWESMQWGQFKPDTPYVHPDGKVVKYEVPPKTATRAYFLKVTFALGSKIAKKLGLEKDYGARILQAYTDSQKVEVRETGAGTREPVKTRGRGFAKDFRKSSRSWNSSRFRRIYSRRERVAEPSTKWLRTTEDKGFWAWVLENPEVPVIITEGSKKAACLLSHGFTAIALPGIFNGYRSKDEQGNQIKPQLIPELQAIAQKKRPIYVCFDRDTKQQTIRNVNIATSQLSRLFQAKECDVKVITLPGPEKGVDDFIVAQGILGDDALCQLYDSAMPLATWQISLLRKLSYEPSGEVILTKHLENVSVPDDAKLVVFKAPKGSGKTEVIARLCEEAYHKGQPAIVLTYREQLGRELSRRFELPYKTELKETPEGKLYGFALCVDSCHPKSEARFTGDSWADALVIIDEIESVVWHLLNSATCTKNRLTILGEVGALFTGALSSDSKGRVVLADADLSDLTVDFVKGLAGQSDIKPYVIRSDYVPDTVPIAISYETPVDLYDTLVKAVAEGGKHIIFTTGQQVTSKWGSQNLEKTLSEQFPRARILTIDRNTVADPNHAAYGCIDNLKAVLPEWDIVIATPVIESGVSIELYNHFAALWGFFSGVIPTDNVRQTLARVRDTSVPRHVWMPEKGMPTSFVGNGAYSPSALRNGELKKSKANFSFLLNAGVTVDADGSVQTNTSALETWLKMASRINFGFHNYRAMILADLEAEGYECTQLDLLLDPETGKSLSEMMADSRDELKEDEAGKIVEAHPPKSEAEYEKLKSQKTKTPEQRRSQVNYEIQQRYIAPPTVGVILKDWDGWHPHLRLHYYLTVGNQYLSSRDGKRFGDIAQDGRSWIPDTNRVLLSNKIRALKALEIEKIFVPGVDWTQDSPEIQEIVNKALTCAKDIKLFLGVTVTPANQPMAIVQEILSQTIGFRLRKPPKEKPQFIEKEVDSEGKRQRIRIYNFVYPKDRGEVFDRWLLRDAELAERTENVSISDTFVDHQTPIDLSTGFSDPSFSDPKPETPKKATPQNPPIQMGVGAKGWYPGQRVETWWTVGRYWCGGLIQSVEVNVSGCFKAVVKLTNGVSKYVWDESELVAL